MTNNNPIVTIQLKRFWYWTGLILSIVLTIYAIFGVIIPVLSSGDFNAIWPHDIRTGRNACIFIVSFLGIVSFPAMFRCLYVGDFRFYNNRFEIHTYLFSRIRIYYYEDITVNQHGSHRVTIHQRNLPGWKHPLKKLKALYFDGTTFGLSPKGYIDPNTLPVALNILKNCTEFNLKAIS